MILDRRLFAQFDWLLLGTALLVPLAGLLVLYSAGYDPDLLIKPISWLPFGFQSMVFVRQATFVMVGFIVLLVAITLPTTFLHRFAYLFYGFCIILLAGLYLFGQAANGAVRWYSFGVINIQPSELMKLGLILAMARYLSKHPPALGGYGPLDVLVPFGLFLLPMALIAPQPDLGTALSVGATGFGMVLFMGIRWRFLLTLVLIGGLAAIPGWHLLKPFQRARLQVLFAPEADPAGTGYHIIQSKIAVGSGSIFGKGFLNGTQNQLSFLPEHTTDFIFSVVAEEWGFMGGLVVVALLLALIFRILRVAQRSKELFSALIPVGVATLIFFHGFVNIGMVIGIVPVVGVPLPFFSYGGSAVVTLLTSVGVVLGISMRRFLYVTRAGM